MRPLTRLCRRGRLLLAPLAGMALWGAPGAVLGVIVAAGMVAAERHRRAAALADRLEVQTVDLLVAMAAALRGGASLAQAILAAHEEAGPPAREALGAAVRALAAGEPAEVAVDELCVRLPAHAATPARLALQVGRRSGAHLARLLDRAASSLRDRRRLADERQAATAQARLSAVVIGALPLAALAIQRDAIGVLVGTPAGRLLAAAGLTLEAAGWMWVRRLMRG